MSFRNRGPVTKENSVFSSDGRTVYVPLSTNRWTDDEYVVIDRKYFKSVCGRYLCVRSNGKEHPSYHVAISLPKDVIEEMYDGEKTVVSTLYKYLFWEDLRGTNHTVDHCVHWLDNRRGSVAFVPMKENSRRGRPGSRIRKKSSSDILTVEVLV